MDIKCEFKELVDIIKLVPNPKNPNKHSDKQIDLLQKLIEYQGWRHPIIVSNRSGFVCAGHGRLQAAIKMGLKQVPVDYQDFDSEAQEYAFLVSDNAIQELSELDKGMINSDIGELGPDFDVELLGLDGFEIDAADNMQLNESDPESEGDEKRFFNIFTIDEIANLAFDEFREKGFPYIEKTISECMCSLNKLSILPLEKCKSTRLAYSVPDSYHRHRFELSAIDMKSPLDAFNDNKDLSKAIRWELESTGKISYKYLGTLSLVNGTQACSNFRPGFARYLYDTYAPKGAHVFDSSTGFGGRLTGFLASHCAIYTGIDPNTKTYRANIKLSDDLGKNKIVDLHNLPIENFDESTLNEKCDFAFTSPPYFSKEIYSDEATQSYQRYPLFTDWLEGFLRQMLRKQFNVLKKGCFSVVNIEDVTIKNKKYELVKETISLSKAVGFTFEKEELFEMATRTKVKDGEIESEKSAERVLFFKK